MGLSVFIFHRTAGEVVISSLSSDGHYVITTDAKNTAILWNLETKNKTILSHDANMYSAYWIKHTDYYMWQDLKTKKVHVMNSVTNQEVKLLHLKFLVYGQAMSADMKYYVASDANWNILASNNNYLKLVVKHYTDVPGFEGANKIINFTMLGNDKVLASGFGNAGANDNTDVTGVFLFDLNILKPIHDYIGNQVQTFATVSPDGKYVVAGDGSGNIFIWGLKTGKRLIRNAQLYLGLLQKNGSKDYHKWTFDNSKLIKVPSEFNQAEAGTQINSIKFIDKTHYLVFYNASHFAVLFSIKSPWPIKYLNLGASPMPALKYFERDQSMDTSPSTHTLVMAKETAPGILVYKYNPKTQTLKKVWDAS